MDGRRLRPRLRGPAPPRRRHRRSLRTSQDAPRRARDLRRRLRRGDAAGRRLLADRDACRARRRRRAGHARDPVDDHLDLPVRRAGEGRRHLGRRRRCVRDPRTAHLGRRARVLVVARGLRGERRAGRGRDRRHPARRTGVRRPGRATTRPDGCPDLAGLARCARLLRHRGADPWVDRCLDPRRARRGPGRSRRLRRLRATPSRAAARPAAVHLPRVRGRDRDDHRAVLRILRLHLPAAAVPPAGARRQPTQGGAQHDPLGVRPDADRTGAGAQAHRADRYGAHQHPRPGHRGRVVRLALHAGRRQQLLAAARRPGPARGGHGAGDDARDRGDHRCAPAREAGCRLGDERPGA